jgi:hypothetical protein
MGVAEYRVSLPKRLADALPSVQELAEVVRGSP